MTSTLPSKGTIISGVHVNSNKMDNRQKIPTDPSKDESRSFLSFSRENLSISHSDLEQGFNRSRPRVRMDTILSITAIFLALFCIGLEIWKIQVTIDNAREIDVLKQDVETMKHRLLEEDLLDELKAFEEQMNAEDDDDDDDDEVESEDDYVYDGEYDDDDDDENDESVLASDEYLSDYHSAPYKTQTSGSVDEKTVSGLKRESDLDGVLAALRNVETKRGQEFDNGFRDNREKIDRERLTLNDKNQRSAATKIQQKKLSPIDDQRDKDLEEFVEGDAEKMMSTSIKQKRSLDRQEERPIGFNPSGIPIYANSYLPRRAGRNSTRNNLTSPKLRLYDTLMKNHGKIVTTERSEAPSSIHHSIITSWDQHPPKKYYAQSRPETSHVTPPPSYSSRLENPRQINGRRSGGWREEEGPQALTRKDSSGRITQREGSDGALKELPGATSRLLKRRGMTRRHLRGQKMIVAAHYSADSTLFSSEDEHLGNGKGRHDRGIFKAWRASNWMSDLGMNQHFTLTTDGDLTVQETGLYIIYAQIHYLDAHDENGFQVLVNGNSILQCMVYSPGTEHKSRSCFSAQATFLQSGDHLLLKDVGDDRYTLFQHDKSFFGLVKLGDPRIPPARQMARN